MKKTFLFLITLLLVASTAAAEVVERVVAVVGTEIITLSDLKKFSANGSRQDPLDALIREKLLKAEMERLGVAATAAEIEAAIQDVAKRNNITVGILKGELARKGVAFEQYKKDLGGQIRQMKFLSQVIFPRIKLSEDEIIRKAGPKASEEARMKARFELMQARSSEELAKYLDEARGKTFVEIKYGSSSASHRDNDGRSERDRPGDHP